MTILKNNKLLQYLIIILFVIVCGLNIFSSCASKYSGEKNITAKNIDCNILTINNALFCCLQLMSSGTGNDSKDIFCSKIETETAEYLRQGRKRKLFTFCFKDRDNSEYNCWDKLHTK